MDSPILCSLPALVREAVRLGGSSLAEPFERGSGNESSSPLKEHVQVAVAALMTEARGDHATAAPMYADATARWEAFTVVPEQGFALLGQGRCLVQFGRPAEAEPVLSEARRIFEMVGACPPSPRPTGCFSARSRGRRSTPSQGRLLRTLPKRKMRGMDLPETRYAKTSDGVHIAYQVLGEGPFDFVAVPSMWLGAVDLAWDFPLISAANRFFSARGRLVLFDRRGSGSSDPVPGDTPPPIESCVEDIHSVMDAAGVERAVLWAVEEGAAQSFVFAATYPERTAAIIANGTTVRGLWSSDFPWAMTRAEWDEWLATIEADFGSAAFTEDLCRSAFPSKAHDPGFVQAFGRVIRHSLSPSQALAADRMNMETDVRHVLPLIQAPTLVIHSIGDQVESIGQARYVAEHIPGASLVVAPGKDHHWWPGLPASAGIDTRVDEFLASLKDEELEFDRVLATVLFTDIVGSTERASELGDRRWHDLIDRHHAAVRAMLGRYRGREVDTAGDGFFATFDGPARAIRCARAITEAVRPLGLEVRAGLHTGEVETVGDDVRGVAVHIGARVAALAGASEVLVSSTVKDLVAGSGLTFEDAGEHELKGVPDRWRLYRLAVSST